MPVLLTITVNGRRYVAPAGVALPDFLRMLGWEPRRAAVTRNGRPVPRGEVAGLTLENGDVLEIVTLEAGG
jgi:thiamine biosynthesis protein ThiS